MQILCVNVCISQFPILVLGLFFFCSSVCPKFWCISFWFYPSLFYYIIIPYKCISFLYLMNLVLCLIHFSHTLMSFLYQIAVYILVVLPFVYEALNWSMVILSATVYLKKKSDLPPSHIHQLPMASQRRMESGDFTPHLYQNLPGFILCKYPHMF